MPTLERNNAVARMIYTSTTYAMRRFDCTYTDRL